MIVSPSWRRKLRRESEHRPIKICGFCLEEWPCHRERERVERLRQRAEVIEAILAARRK